MAITRVSTGVKAIAGSKTEPQSDERHLSAAVNWLCRSQDATSVGGSASCYNLIFGWGDAYPETTGYIVPTLFTYAERADRSDVADRAIRMVNWLCGVQHHDGSYPAGTGGTGDPSVFNTGQIVFGLVAAYRETSEEAYRRAALRACDWLVDHQADDGHWSSYTYRDNVHTYSTRVAWALLEGSSLADCERAASYRRAARNNLEWAVERRRPNGWFDGAGFGDGDRAFLHTIAYTIRGLLEGSVRLDDSSLVTAAKVSADVLLTRQQSNGILKGSYDDDWSPSWYHCLPGNAQMAVIWSKLHRRTDDRAYLTAARETIEFLKHRQPLDGPDPIRGALAGSSPIVGRYMFLRYPNWGVKFFVDALLSARSRDERVAGEPLLV